MLLKRGISATIEEWLLSAEYVLAGGNQQVVLCERGIRTFESYTRNTLDISAIPVVKKLSHLPIVVDPSHGTGRRDGRPVAPAAVKQDFPTVREWARGDRGAVRREPRPRGGRRAAARPAALGAMLELDPDAVTPSVELLEQVLSLKGGLSEDHLGRLRRIVAASSTSSSRSSPSHAARADRRALARAPDAPPGRPAPPARTVAANLAVRRRGRRRVHDRPRAPVFKHAAAGALDWRVVLVVDVSGSMEAVGHLQRDDGRDPRGLPWIRSTSSPSPPRSSTCRDHVGDPLGLLLEVSVGGGTHIAKGLRYARELSRSRRGRS